MATLIRLARRNITKACPSAVPAPLQPNSCETASRKAPSKSRDWGTRTYWCRPGPACVSRKTGGSKSLFADRGPYCGERFGARGYITWRAVLGLGEGHGVQRRGRDSLRARLEMAGLS